MADNVPSDRPTILVSSQGQDTQPAHMITKDEIENISQNLRDQLSKSIKDMKAFSNEVSSESHDDAELFEEVSSLSPEEYFFPGFDPVLLRPQYSYSYITYLNPKKKGKRQTTKVVGEFSLSYEMPPICIQNNIELDHNWQLLSDESGSSPNKYHQFSFIERLQNWTLRLRRRTTGTHCDVYYSHMMSGGLFRSKNEVVNFMIHEKYPPKPTNKKQKKLQVMEEASSAASNNDSLGQEKKNKQKCDGEIDQMAIDRERVVKFLAESYENLMNRDKVGGPK